MRPFAVSLASSSCCLLSWRLAFCALSCCVLCLLLNELGGCWPARCVWKQVNCELALEGQYWIARPRRTRRYRGLKRSAQKSDSTTPGTVKGSRSLIHNGGRSASGSLEDEGRSQVGMRLTEGCSTDRNENARSPTIVQTAKSNTTMPIRFRWLRPSIVASSHCMVATDGYGERDVLIPRSSYCRQKWRRKAGKRSCWLGIPAGAVLTPGLWCVVCRSLCGGFCL